MPRRKPQDEIKPARPKAATLEGRENQMVSLAVDLAEKQLQAGTASAQVITHFLKLGTVREQLEREKLVRENRLLDVRSDAIESGRRLEDLYLEALNAMRTYGGGGASPDED